MTGSDKPPGGATRAVAVLCIGASTGGPQCVRVVLGKMDPTLGPPVIVVQHMGVEFIPGFVHWLGQSISLPIEIARSGMLIAPGRVYVAPGNRHLKLVAGSLLTLSDEPPVQYQRPAIDVLFGSVAHAHQANAAGVLLTGMGEDGARGLLALRKSGSLTIAQDEASAAASSMPRAAVRLGAAELVLGPEVIATRLERLRYAAPVTRPTLTPPKGSARP